MFRSSTILRELVQSLAKVTLVLKHSVQLRHYISSGDLAACRETACLLFVVQTDIESKAQITNLSVSEQYTHQYCLHTTLCNRVPSEKQIVHRAVQEFPVFHGTLWFII